MRVLLSTIGGRGDVHPLLALGIRLTSLGRQVRLCAPPDFHDLATGHGLHFTPIGPELQSGALWPHTLADLERLVPEIVADQFRTLLDAAADCDVIVGCNQLQVTARSVAQLLGIRYLYVARSPISLPSPHHAPPRPVGRHHAETTVDNLLLWERSFEQQNSTWLAALNSQRAAVDLVPVNDVCRHVLTDRPLLAADGALAPWPPSAGLDVRQTGAWVLPDRRPLPDDVEKFLAAGDPPVYLESGNVASSRTTSQAMVASVRTLGCRAMVRRGWAEVCPVDGPDLLAVADVNQQSLFSRVAAVVHRGGTGITTTAARSGAPQVIVPHHYDQFYFAKRVQDLGIGAAHSDAEPTSESLAEALELALRPTVLAQARAFAAQVRSDGTTIAAQYVR